MVDFLAPRSKNAARSEYGKPSIRAKRVYEPPSPEDGSRVLVDRLWPRGLHKADAAIDCWLKEIAPSSELRRWFGHDPGRWEEFQRRYQAELSPRPELLEKLRAQAAQGTLTLVYAARDADHNHAVALRGMLLRKRTGGASRGGDIRSSDNG
jgi:uncharacterized protein YeaO (DUF488 family)